MLGVRAAASVLVGMALVSCSRDPRPDDATPNVTSPRSQAPNAWPAASEGLGPNGIGETGTIDGRPAPPDAGGIDVGAIPRLREARGPQMSLASAGADEGLTQGEVTTSLWRIQRELEACVLPAFARGGRTNGSLELRLSVDSTGGVTSAALGPTDLAGAEVSACVTREAKRIVVPAPRSRGGSKIVYSLDFRVGG